jgi:hypothetical protein
MSTIGRATRWLWPIALVHHGIGCDVPKHRAAVPPNIVAGVPYVDSDPLPQPPPRAVLAAARWVVIATDNPNVLQPVAKPTPAMTSHTIETHGGTMDVRTVTKLRRLAFGRVAPPPEAVEVDATALAELGFAAPADRVWLFGPDGPCHARVTTPMIGRYDGDGEVLEVSWRLEGCLPAAWAPVGVLTDTLVPDLKWASAQTVVDSDFDPMMGWTHPLGSMVDVPTWDAEPPTVHHVIVQEVPDAQPTPLTILYGYARLDPEVSDDPCLATESVAATHGWYDGRTLARFVPVPQPHDVPQLLGAVVQDNSTEALVYADGLDIAVAIVPTPPPPALENAPMETAPLQWGPDTWTHVTVSTGHYAASQWDDARVSLVGCVSGL